MNDDSSGRGPNDRAASAAGIRQDSSTTAQVFFIQARWHAKQPSVSSDAELLGSWRRGDQSAGAALIEKHYESVLRFFRTKAGDDGDDLVQQTFLRCVEGAGRFRGDSSFRAFLFGIARNVLYEHIRKKMRDRKADPDFGVSSILDLNPRASTIALRMAEQRSLVEALQRMPVEVQIVLELYYWEELSVGEVAEAVEVPAGTVKSRLHRGRTLLREAMEAAPAGSPSRVSLSQWLERKPDE